MADQRPRISQKVSGKLTIEHSVTTTQFELTSAEARKLEELAHEFIQTDKTIATLEEKRENLKASILGMFGKNAQHLIGLRLRYPRNKQRTIRFWLNRHQYDLEKLSDRLRNHLSIFKKTVSEGTVIRLVIPASPANRESVISRAEKELGKHFPKAIIVAYRSGQLEQMVRENELVELTEKAGVSLRGTRKSVFNTRVYDD